MARMRLRLGALLGWGIVIYAVMFLLWSGFVVYGFVGGLLPRTLSLMTLIIISLIAGRSLHARSIADILPYSISWTLMMILLDMLMTSPLTGWQIYGDWNVWFGYSIVLLVPLLALYPRFGFRSTRTV